jgi:hypothetical protein
MAVVQQMIVAPSSMAADAWLEAVIQMIDDPMPKPAASSAKVADGCLKALTLWFHLLLLPIETSLLFLLEEDFFLAGELNTLKKLDQRADISVQKLVCRSNCLDDLFYVMVHGEKINV